MVLEGYARYPELGTRRIKSHLTPRQKQIVKLLAEGKSSKEIAATLKISIKTAETHRTNILRRLDYHSVTELVRYAIRNHLIEA
jgi:DNA-binding NarL/FixJ family response regulator